MRRRPGHRCSALNPPYSMALECTGHWSLHKHMHPFHTQTSIHTYSSSKVQPFKTRTNSIHKKIDILQASKHTSLKDVICTRHTMSTAVHHGHTPLTHVRRSWGMLGSELGWLMPTRCDPRHTGMESLTLLVTPLSHLKLCQRCRS